MLVRKSLHMRFINNRPVPRCVRRAIRSPCECRINHDALQHSSSAVSPVERKIFVAMANPVAKVRVVPLQTVLDLLRIRVQKELVPIEPQSLCGIIRSVDTVSITKTRSRLWQIAVPYLVGLFLQRNAVNLATPRFVEQR